MNELDRLGTAAAAGLLAEVTPSDTAAALAAVRLRADLPVERARWPLMAMAAAAVVVLVAGLVVIARRDPDPRVDAPIAPPPTSTPATTLPAVGPVPSTETAAAPPTTTAAPTSEPADTTGPATMTSTPTTEPATTGAGTVSPSTDPTPFVVGFQAAPLYVGDDGIWVVNYVPDESAELWASADGGASWRLVAVPGVPPGNLAAFASFSTGWVYADGAVQETRDGGTTWRPIDISSPDGSGVDVLGLGVGAGYVHAFAVDQNEAMTMRLYTMPVAGETFTATDVEFAPPAGGRPTTSFAFAGESGRFAYNSRTLLGTATFGLDGWVPDEPIDCPNGPLTFSSSGEPLDMLYACDAGYMGDVDGVVTGTHLYKFYDSGDAELAVPTAASGPFVRVFAHPQRGTIVAGPTAVGSGEPGLFVTHDDGELWEPVDGFEGVLVNDLDASGPLWVAAVADFDGHPRLWVSRDAGATWHVAGQ